MNKQTVTTISGRHGDRSYVDGSSLLNARFNEPVGLVLDSMDNIYVVDNGDEDCLKIRKISIMEGTTTTVKLDQSQLEFHCYSNLNFDNFGNILVPIYSAIPDPSPSKFVIKKIMTGFLTKKEYGSIKNHLSTPLEYIGTLLEHPADTKADIKFEIEGTILEAHQCILIAQSPVFMKLLSDKFKENREGKVVINDTTAEAFQAFLKIMYTGDKVKYFNDEVVCDLYFLAEKYMFEDLESYCEFQIKKSSAKYLIQRFIWADAHDTLTEILEYLKTQIVKNYIKKFERNILITLKN